MKRILILTILPVCTIWSLAQGTNYYVKPTGHDSLSGETEPLAWQHVQRACTTVTDGDTCFIRAGTYDEDSPATWDYEGNGTYNSGLVPCTGVGLNGSSARDGTPGNHIVFKGYRGDVRPIILGNANRSAAQVSGCDYLTYDSLEFRFGRRSVWTTGNRHLTLRYCVIDSSLGTLGENNGGFSAPLDGGEVPAHILIEHCEMFDNGLVGDGYRGVWNTAGVMLYECDSCEFRYNEFWGSGFGLRCKYVGGADDSLSIHHNTFRDIPFTGVSFTAGWTGIYVHHNVFYNVGYSDEGTAGIASNLGTSPPSTLIYIFNNTIDCDSAVGGISMYSANTGSAWDSLLAFNNIIYNPAKNNLFSAFGFGTGHPARAYEDYNLYYGLSDSAYFHWDGANYTFGQWQANNIAEVTGKGANSTVANPLFVDRANNNYALSPGSPALSGGKGGAYPTYMGAFAPTGTLVRARIRAR